MKQYDFDRVIDRRNTHSIKWDGIPDKECLPLWVADMDFAAADPIIDALRERIGHGVFGYSQYDCAQTKSAVTGWFSRRFGWNIAPDTIFFCPGIVPALAILVRALTKPGDSIVIQRPVYHPFTNKIVGNDRRAVNNALICEDGRYTIDFNDLDHKLARPDVKGLLLCSPHNPVGRVWTSDELRRVVEVCKQHGKWIISDEIHCDILRAGVVHHPLASLCADYADRIITCTAPTKTFNLAGVQVSNVIISNLVYQKLWREEVEARMGLLDASPFAIAAITAAYNEGEEWLDQANAYIDRNMALADDFLRRELPLARMAVPEGTYLLWIDLRGYVSEADKLERLLREQAKVEVNQGYIFGEEGAGFVRVNAACPKSVLQEALKRIKNAL